MKITDKIRSLRELNPNQTRPQVEQQKQQSTNVESRQDVISVDPRIRAERSEGAESPRSKKVEEIKARVNEGSYRIDRIKVAESLIRDLG